MSETYVVRVYRDERGEVVGADAFQVRDDGTDDDGSDLAWRRSGPRGSARTAAAALEAAMPTPLVTDEELRRALTD